MTRIVVLGAGGFIGRALVARLARETVSLSVVAASRRPVALVPAATGLVTGDLSPATDWGPWLVGADSVVHLATSALARDESAAARARIEAEVATARALAASAARSGLRQLVLMSSIKAHGDATREAPFRAEMPLAPAGLYATAKARIESAMREGLAESATALAVIRPPLVFGPGVGGNFRALLRLVRWAPALPFASIANRRSFVYRENLVDLVARILLRPEPTRGALLVRDGEDLSTPELVRRIGRHFGRSPALLPCPLPLLRALGHGLGRGEAVEQLTRSLRVDDGATRDSLGWTPPFGTDEGLAATCRWYLDRGSPP
jgi:nucleoside-diphosphate-sugar epimerase